MVEEHLEEWSFVEGNYVLTDVNHLLHQLCTYSFLHGIEFPFLLLGAFAQHPLWFQFEVDLGAVLGIILIPYVITLLFLLRFYYLIRNGSFRTARGKRVPAYFVV